MKKLPPSNAQKEIFSENSGQLVQLQGHAALLAGSVVLVQKTLDNSLVHSLDGNLVGALCSGMIAGLQSGLELLQVGLQLGLISLVLLISDFRQLDALFRGFDVGNCGDTSCSPTISYSFTL